MYANLLSLDTNLNYTCGSGTGFVFSGVLPQTVSTIVTIIKIAIPILLIIFGMLDLGKAVIAQKDDEIKKGQQTFIKRLIAAAVVFFVVVVVQLVVGLVAGASKDSISKCIDCFISGNDQSCTIAK
ncbi:MAG TPA: hypothetical protein GX747_03915 [Tenericutes bacterium]|nr:hypothetical protein [Mycoplasmatota bacterium]